jgi:hypothetical protein
MNTNTIICIAFAVVGFWFWHINSVIDRAERRILARLDKLEEKIQKTDCLPT